LAWHIQQIKSQSSVIFYKYKNNHAFDSLAALLKKIGVKELFGREIVSTIDYQVRGCQKNMQVHHRQILHTKSPKIAIIPPQKSLTSFKIGSGDICL
jgi:hypothetical protein